MAGSEMRGKSSVNTWTNSAHLKVANTMVNVSFLNKPEPDVWQTQQATIVVLWSRLTVNVQVTLERQICCTAMLISVSIVNLYDAKSRNVCNSVYDSRLETKKVSKSRQKLSEEYARLCNVSGEMLQAITHATEKAEVDSAFYPPWDGKMSISRRAVMLCGWGVKAGMV